MLNGLDLFSGIGGISKALEPWVRTIAYCENDRYTFDGWKSQPTIRRGANGVSNRVDRLRGLGNAVVPAQAREAFERLCGLK